MAAEQSDRMVELPAPTTAKAPGDRFTGDVWVDRITDGAHEGAPTLATVRFCPASRTAWHRHAAGQTLHVADGDGLVATRDGRVIAMRAGDTVYTPPGVWHWHGAGRHSFMTHLALSAAGGAVDWADLVTDHEYEEATAGAGWTRGTR